MIFRGPFGPGAAGLLFLTLISPLAISAGGCSEASQGPPYVSSGGQSAAGSGSSAGDSASGSGSGGGSAGTAGGLCSGPWQGAVRTFDAARQLSGDSASAILEAVFLPTTTQVVVLEPTIPDLMLVRADQNTASQRIDSASLPVNPSSPPKIYKASDESGATIVYGFEASYVSSDGRVHGPYQFAPLGLLSLSSVVTLEAGAGAVVLGLDQDGPAWTTLGPNGFGPLKSIALGVTPDATQPPTVVWDDGTGRLSALLPISYGSGTGHALFVMRGGGTPFIFGQPVRLDLDGQVLGFEMAIGPNGETGVLLQEGAASSDQLSGYVVTGASNKAGGLIASLTTPLAFPLISPYSTPWSAGSSACGPGVSCDPGVRFDGNGQLIAGWTAAGQLSVARLPASSSGWLQSGRAAGGPLTTPMAVDGLGDVSALAQSATGPAVVFSPASGSLDLFALSPMPALSLEAFSAATASGGGAFWSTVSSLPTQISGWTYARAAAPTSGSAVALSLGEQPINLRIAAPAIPSSAGSAFLGPSVPGWMLIDASLGNARDVLLATYDPATGTLATPLSIAASGWQQVGGVSNSNFAVDTQGDALAWFAQPLLDATPPNLYVAFAPASSVPRTGCLPLPAMTTGPSRGAFAEVDQRPYGPEALTGSGRILVGYDSPATTALAH